MNNLKRLALTAITFLIQFLLVGQNVDSDQRDQKGLAIGVKVTTFGPGIEVIKSLNPSFALRAGAAYFTYKYTPDIESGDATTRNSKAKLGAVSLGADWQFVSFMHVSAGALYNFTTINFDVYPTNPDELNNGSIAYNLEPNRFCPYLTLGFGRSISKNKMVSVGFDLGITYQGITSVEYTVTGVISEAKLTKWTNNVKSGATLYKIYPMASLMVAFRIF